MWYATERSNGWRRTTRPRSIDTRPSSSAACRASNSSPSSANASIVSASPATPSAATTPTASRAVGRQPVEPVTERLTDPWPDRQRLDAFGDGHGADQLRQLEEREGVARRDLQRGRSAAGPLIPARSSSNAARVGVGEAGDHELRVGVDPERDALLAADGRDHGDPLGGEAAGRERERFHRGLVDPLRVVDAHEHGVGFRELGEQGQQRDPDGQRVCGLGVVRERAVEGIGLGVGKVRELADRGSRAAR